jgi:flagellar motor switch protein FliG
MSTATLTGTQKAALVLMQIGRDRAAKVMAQLDETSIEELTAEILRMERVDRDMADEVIAEFHARLRPAAPRGVDGRRQGAGAPRPPRHEHGRPALRVPPAG